MLVINATTATEYSTWSKFNSNQFHTILLSDEKREIERQKQQFILNAIPRGWALNYGKGFYQIKEMGVVTDPDKQPAYYASALYKAGINDVFYDDTEVLMYLNPLRYYNSIGRKDVAYENFIGATIEIIRVFEVKSITSKGSYTTLNYEWRVTQFADTDEHLPQSNTITYSNMALDDEALLCYHGY